MINDLDIVQWAYLLDPAFQIVNTAGKPLTDGWIEVYIHGTRNKYYCASDFDGTLHPFKIPLDSLGANIVLASPDYAYDVYIYNKFGSLVMSRYNVTAGKGGGSSGGIPSTQLADHWLGQYGATQRLEGNERGQTLALPLRPDYQGDFVDHVDYGYINGDETNQYPKYMYLKPGLYLVNCVIRFQQQTGTEVNRLDETLVYTGNGNANEDIAWQLDETGPLATGDRHCLKLTFIRKVLDEGETSTVDCSNILYFAPAPQVNWSDAYIQTLQVVKLGAGFGSSYASGGVEYKAGPGISIDIYNNISVTGMQPASAMGDYVTYDVMSNVTSDIITEIYNVTGDIVTLNETVNNITGDVQNLTEIVNNVTGDVNELTTIVNNVTGDIQNISGDINNLETIVNNVTGDVTNLTTIVGDVTGDIQYVSSAIDAVSAMIPDAQVQSDWTEEDPTSKAFIQHKPDVETINAVELVAGSGVIIQEVSGAYIISASGEGGGTGGNYTAGNYISIENEVIAVTGLEPQVNSDWFAASGKAQILNKPTEANLVPGENISITASGDDIIISAQCGSVTGDYATNEDLQIVSAAIPDVSNLATEADLQTVSAAVDSVSAQIPETEEVEFEELDLSDFATVSQVTALESEIQIVSAAIPTQVTGDYVTHQELAEVTGDFATNSDLQTVSGAVDAVSANIPSQIEVEFKELDISQFVTESAVTGLEADIQTVSSAIPTDTVTHAELASVTGDYATNADLQTVSAAIPDVSNLATESDLQTVSAAIPDVSNLATEQEMQFVSGAVDAVSANIPETEEVEFEELDLSQYVTESAVTGLEADIQTVSAAIPDVSNFATEADLQIVSAAIPEEQVNADWDAVSGKAEILNKPDIMDVEIKQITAGENVTITETANAIVISAQGGSATGDYATNEDLQTVSAAVDSVSAQIPESEEVEFEELDLSQFAQQSAVTAIESEIQTVSSAIPTDVVTHDELAGVTGDYATNADLQTVSAAIPDVSNLASNSDLQTVSAAVDEVSGSIPSQIEVEFKELDLSQFVTESAVTGLEAEIQTVSAAIPDVSNLATESDLQTVSAAIPDTSNLATNADLQTVSAAVDSVSGQIPASEEVEFEELDLSTYASIASVTAVEADVQTVSAAIPDISNLATEADLQIVSAAIPDVSNLATKAEVQTASGQAVISASNYTDAQVSGLQDKLTGITDVIVTNSLPASPVATVLYLIPEA